MGEGWLRWIVCSAILVIAYVVMGRMGMRKEALGRGVIAMRSNELQRASIQRGVEGSAVLALVHPKGGAADEPRVLDIGSADGARRTGRGAR